MRRWGGEKKEKGEKGKTGKKKGGKIAPLGSSFLHLCSHRKERKGKEKRRGGERQGVFRGGEKGKKGQSPISNLHPLRTEAREDEGKRGIL